MFTAHTHHLVLISNMCFLPLLLLLIVENKRQSAALDLVFCWWLSKLGLSIPQWWGGNANMLFFVWKFLSENLYLVLGKHEGVQRGKVAKMKLGVCFLCACFARVQALKCARCFPLCQGKTIGLTIICHSKAVGWSAGRTVKDYNSTTQEYNTTAYIFFPTVRANCCSFSSPFLSLSPLFCSTFHPLFRISFFFPQK